MKPPAFSYHRPGTVAEAIGLLATLDDAKLLAGGQSLMPMMNFRYVMPANVIDLNRIAELSAIEERGEALTIGAMARQRDLELSPVVRRRCPLLHEALLHVGEDRFLERLLAYLDLAPALRERVPEIDYVDLRFEERIYVRPAASRDAAGNRKTRGSAVRQF